MPMIVTQLASPQRICPILTEPGLAAAIDLEAALGVVGDAALARGHDANYPGGAHQILKRLHRAHSRTVPTTRQPFFTNSATIASPRPRDAPIRRAVPVR